MRVRERFGLGSGTNGSERDHATLGLGDDLLRDRQHIAVDEPDAVPLERGEEQRSEVVAGAHLGQAADGYDREGYGHTSAPSRYRLRTNESSTTAATSTGFASTPTS